MHPLNHLQRAALPSVMIAAAVLLETGCSSTGAGVDPRPTSPISGNEQPSNSGGDGSYQPARRPEHTLSDFGFLGGA